MARGRRCCCCRDFFVVSSSSNRISRVRVNGAGNDASIILSPFSGITSRVIVDYYNENLYFTLAVGSTVKLYRCNFDFEHQTLINDIGARAALVACNARDEKIYYFINEPTVGTSNPSLFAIRYDGTIVSTICTNPTPDAATYQNMVCVPSLEKIFLTYTTQPGGIGTAVRLKIDSMALDGTGRTNIKIYQDDAATSWRYLALGMDYSRYRNRLIYSYSHGALFTGQVDPVEQKVISLSIDGTDEQTLYSVTKVESAPNTNSEYLRRRRFQYSEKDDLLYCERRALGLPANQQQIQSMDFNGAFNTIVDGSQGSPNNFGASDFLGFAVGCGFEYARTKYPTDNPGCGSGL